MYTKYVFETAEEFFRACGPTDATVSGDRSLSVPDTVYVVFNGDDVYLSGGGAHLFELSPDISQDDMIAAAFKLLHTKVHFT